MSRHHRTHRAGWDRLRKRALAAAGRRCSRCGRAGRLEVHHVRPLSLGGDNRSPVAVVCRNCHFSQHNPPDPAREEWVRFLHEEFAC